MKKTYIAPETSIYKVENLDLLFQASGVEGLTGGGQSSGGLSADSRSSDWDDDF